MRRRRSGRTLTVLSMAGWVVALSAGCPIGDPGLGVSGDLSLGGTVDASGYAYLKIRAFPDDAEWSPADGCAETDQPFDRDLELSQVTFPYHYVLDSLGTVPQKNWRVVAWITQDASGEAPASGDWWGTERFAFKDCQQYGDYCDDVDGVDLTLDQRVP